MLLFAGFELDRQRAELRGPSGEAIRLRPKSFDILQMLATNPGRVLSKHELMAAVWPNIHVGEDSLFQCIREVRAALGDDKRTMIRVMSGRGYLFEAEVLDTTALDTTASNTIASAAPGEAAIGPSADVTAAPPVTPQTKSEPAKRWLAFSRRRGVALVAVVGLALLSLAVIQRSGLLAEGIPTIAVLPITTASPDPLSAQMAANVASRLTDGLATIETIRVVVPSTTASSPDFVVNSELEKTEAAWRLRARMTETATGAIKWTETVSVGLTDIDVHLQQSRLTAGLGHALALRINALQSSGQASGDRLLTSNAKVAIEQATASINQTTLERFRAAETILAKAHADDPDNVDLQVELAAFQLRGIQMAWFPPAGRDATENNARMMLERASRLRPNSIPVLESYCRFLSATNNFVESLVVCGRAVANNPWSGVALYLIGLGQLHLARYDDALATFKKADQFDTPQTARWTWMIGAGWTYLSMGKAEEALPWLQRSIAITPASGRTHMLLAAAYQQLGRTGEAAAAMAKAMELRPGSSAQNVSPPWKNASPAFIEASKRLVNLMVLAGLPKS